MLTSTFSISKLNGVHSTKNIIKHNATMHTTGKISEENLIYLITTLKSSVQIGNQELSLVNIKKDVYFKELVLIVMDGKNKNITHTIIRLNNVKIKNVKEVLPVHSIIVVRKREMHQKLIKCNL
jgi:hypothetical protein